MDRRTDGRASPLSQSAQLLWEVTVKWSHSDAAFVSVSCSDWLCVCGGWVCSVCVCGCVCIPVAGPEDVWAAQRVPQQMSAGAGPDISSTAPCLHHFLYCVHILFWLNHNTDSSFSNKTCVWGNHRHGLVCNLLKQLLSDVLISYSSVIRPYSDYTLSSVNSTIQPLCDCTHAADICSVYTHCILLLFLIRHLSSNMRVYCHGSLINNK